jgi:hypothetical protein
MPCSTSPLHLPQSGEDYGGFLPTSFFFFRPSSLFFFRPFSSSSTSSSFLLSQMVNSSSSSNSSCMPLLDRTQLPTSAESDTTTQRVYFHLWGGGVECEALKAEMCGTAGVGFEVPSIHSNPTPSSSSSSRAAAAHKSQPLKAKEPNSNS